MAITRHPEDDGRRDLDVSIIQAAFLERLVVVDDALSRGVLTLDHHLVVGRDPRTLTRDMKLLSRVMKVEIIQEGKYYKYAVPAKLFRPARKVGEHEIYPDMVPLLRTVRNFALQVAGGFLDDDVELANYAAQTCDGLIRRLTGEYAKG